MLRQRVKVDMGIRKITEDLAGRARVYSSLRSLYHRSWYREEWARRVRLREFTRQFVRRGDLVFDVGANEGRWTAIYQELGGRVIAIEPNGELARRVELRYHPLAVLDCALGAEKGEALLHLGKHSGHSTLSDEWMDAIRRLDRTADWWEGTVKVKVDTLENIVSRFGRPDVLKIDVEGAEAQVLEGLATPIPFIYFEFLCAHLGPASAACSILEEFGSYECNYSISQDQCWELSEWVGPSTLLELLDEYSARNPTSYGDIFARQRKAPASAISL